MTRISLLFILLLISCTNTNTTTTTDTEIHPNPKLRATMTYQVDGTWYTGGIVITRKAKTYKITVPVPKNTNMLFFNSCAREDFYEKPAEGNFNYDYIPANTVENKDSCMLLITAVTGTGEYYRGVIDFANDNGRGLPGEYLCNGRWERAAVGVAFCQQRAGLPVAVRFETPTIFASSKDCAKVTCTDGCTKIADVQLGTYFTIENITEGYCGYDFNDESDKIFRLTTAGYTSILNTFPPKK